MNAPISLLCGLVLCGSATLARHDGTLPVEGVGAGSAATVVFGAPSVVGRSNSTHFYFPSVAVALGAGEIAQHITLCDDSSHCSGNCAQIWRSTGGGRGSTSWSLASTVHQGGSGSFNYYGDLGEVLPLKRDHTRDTTGSMLFTTLAGNNGGSWLAHAVSLQRWESNATGLFMVGNDTAQLTGTPEQFTGSCGSTPPTACGLGQGGRVVRTSEGALLAAFGGFASDSPTRCKPHAEAWARCYTLALYTSTDEGATWKYTMRLDHTLAMPPAVEGPCEPTLVRLSLHRFALFNRTNLECTLFSCNFIRK